MIRQHTLRAARVLLLAVLAASTFGPAAAAAQPIRPLSAFPRERIAIETRSARRHLFVAWRADTYESRAQGLMFVERMSPGQAMIFVYTPAQQVSMWMKNTLIPLDMLFVDARGCIVHLHERARPGALDTITTEIPVVLVVELAGGIANTLGIAAGDRVVRPEAQWPQSDAACAMTP
jgi:uncharacterized membrane protein (UPF0127 family)